MRTEKVFAENVISGVVTQVPAFWLTHPTFGKDLRERRTGKPVLRLPVAEVKEVEADTAASETNDKPDNGGKKKD